MCWSWIDNYLVSNTSSPSVAGDGSTGAYTSQGFFVIINEYVIKFRLRFLITLVSQRTTCRNKQQRTFPYKNRTMWIRSIFGFEPCTFLLLKNNLLIWKKKLPDPFPSAFFYNIDQNIYSIWHLQLCDIWQADAKFDVLTLSKWHLKFAVNCGNYQATVLPT